MAMRHHKYEQRLNKCLEMKRRSAKNREIAEELNLCLNAVEKMVTELVDRGKYEPGQVSDQRAKAIRKSLESGLSVTQAARKHCVARNTVYKAKNG